MTGWNFTKLKSFLSLNVWPARLGSSQFFNVARRKTRAACNIVKLGGAWGRR